MKPTSAPILFDLEELEIRKILKDNFIGSLAFIAHDDPHVLPITYFFDEVSNSLISYSNDGYKVRAMRINPSVSMGIYEMETPVSWKSVLVHGIYEELEQIDAKAHLRRFAEGVRELLSIKGIKDEAYIPDFSSKTTGGTAPLVYRIRILEWSGKCRGEKMG